MYVFSNLSDGYHQLAGLREFILEDVKRTEEKIRRATKKGEIACLKYELAAYQSIVWAIENSSEWKRRNGR